jgi:hypothetical protein
LRSSEEKMAAAPTVTSQKTKGNIKLKRLIRFHGSNSLGITLPSDFVHKLGLVAGQFVKCEINDTDTTMTVEKIDLG